MYKSYTFSDPTFLLQKMYTSTFFKAMLCCKIKNIKMAKMLKEHGNQYFFHRSLHFLAKVFLIVHPWKYLTFLTGPNLFVFNYKNGPQIEPQMSGWRDMNINQLYAQWEQIGLSYTHGTIHIHVVLVTNILVGCLQSHVFSCFTTSSLFVYLHLGNSYSEIKASNEPYFITKNAFIYGISFINSVSKC